MTKNEALFKYILRLADNGLILGQRLSEWCGHAHILEEDIALSNIALDLIGNSNALYQYASQVEGKGRTEDDLAFLRSEREYLNSLLVEQPNTDFAFTIVRQLFIDVYDYYLYQELTKSADSTIAAIAAKTTKEVNYHLRHSSSWVERLGLGTKESNSRMQNAIDNLYRFTGELFEMNEVDSILLKEKIAVDLNVIKAMWEKKVNDIVSAAGLKLPANVFMQRGSRDGKHTEHLGHMLSEMQYLQRSFPGAKW